MYESLKFILARAITRLLLGLLDLDHTADVQCHACE